MSDLATARKQFPHLNDYTDQEIFTLIAKQNNITADSPTYKQLQKQLLGYERTRGEAVKDAVVGVGQGVVGLARGLNTAMQANFGGASDQVNAMMAEVTGRKSVPAVDTNAFANEQAQRLDTTRDALEQKKSAGLRNRQAGSALSVDIAGREAKARGEGAWGTITAEAGAKMGSYVDNPQLVVQDLASNLPQIMGPAAAGRLAQGKALAAGVSEKAAGRVGLAAGVGTGGYMQGADIASDTYQRAIKEGATPEQASQLATQAGVKSGLATVGLSLTPLGGTIERSMLRGAAGATAGRGLGQIGGRVVAGTGEAVSEALEEGYGQFAGNQAIKTVNPNTDLAAGVGAAAVQGAVAGGPLGAVMARPGQPRTETGEISLTSNPVTPDPLDVPTYERRGLDPLNERSSPWAPTPTPDPAPAPDQTQGSGIIMVAPDGTALPAQTPEQMARLEEMRQFTDGIPTLNDQLAPADGVPVLNDRVEGVPSIPVLTDELAPADGIPVLTDEVDNPIRPNRGTVLRALQAANTELGATAVRKDGQVAATRAAAPLREVLESKEPLAAIREMHQDGNAPRDELLDAWHKQLTGQTVFDWKAAQQAPAAAPVTQADISPPVALEQAAMAQEAAAAAAPAPAPAVVEPAGAVAEPAAAAPAPAPAAVEPAAVAPTPAQPLATDAAVQAEEAPKKSKLPKYGRKPTDELIDISDNTKDEAEYEQARYELYRRWSEGDEKADAYLTEGADVSTGKGLAKFLARPEIKAFKLRHDAELKEKGAKKGAKLGEKFGAKFRSNGKTGAVTVAQAQAIAAAVTRGWTNAAEIEVVATMDDLPAAILKQAVLDGATNVRGAYADGKVWVVAENHATPGDVVATVLHEVAGHHGLRGLLGAEFEATMRAIYNGNTDMRQAADARGGNVELAIEEILAESSESGKVAPTAIEKIGNAIRKIMRRVGLGRFAAGVTNAEVKELIAEAREFAMNGPATSPVRERAQGGSPEKAAATAEERKAAFDRWFVGSKVVKDGQPLRMYHGTHRSVASFDTKSSGALLGKGTYLTADPADAAAYARHQGGNIMPLYVSLKNPYVINDLFNLPKREELEKRGHDGIMWVDKGEIKWAVAYEPNQIKSATGNNGEYDPSNPDIRFRSAYAKPFADAANTVRAATQAQVTGAEISPKLLSVMTLRQITEQFGAKLPALRHWAEAILTRSSNAAKLAAEADRVALQWEQSVKDPAERTRLADVLLRASIAELELDNTSREYLDELSVADRAEHTALRAQLAALSPESRRTREQALAILSRQWEYTRASLESFINHTVADPGLRNARIEKLKQELGRNRGDYFPLSRFGERIVIGRNAASDGRDVVSFHETAASVEAEVARLKSIGKKADVTLQTARDSRERASTGFIGELHKMIDGTETDSAVKDSMHEALQQLFLKSLPELSGAKAMIRRENVEGYSRDALRAFADSVTRGARYASQLEYAPMIHAARESAEAQSRSSDKRTAAVVIGRKAGEQPRVMVVPVGTDRLEAVDKMTGEGYATEFFNTIPESARERLAAALGGDVDGYVKQVEQVVGRTSEGVEDMRAAKALYNHMVKLQASEANEDPSKVVEGMGQLGYVWFLGLSPAFWVMNTLQNPMIGIPHLGAKYGVGKAAAEWTSAMKWFSAVRMGKVMKDGKTPFSVEWMKEAVRSGELKGISKQELDMLQTLEDRQVLDFTQSMDLSRIGQASSSGRYKFMRFAAAGAHHTEVFNRVTFALASYRLAMKSDAGVTYAEAVKRAENDVAAVHFDYSYANKPALMRGKTSRLMFMFQQYRQHMLYWWANNVKDMIKDEAPGDRTRARKAALLMGATQGMFAGFMGLPFVGTVALIANLLGGDDDEGVPFDFSTWIRDAAVDATGSQEAGEVIAKGVFAALGMNIGQRIGQADLLPFLNEGGSAKFERNTDDKVRAYLYDLAGPLGSIALGAARSLEAFERGDALAGLAATTPKAVSDLLKAYQMDQEGVKNTRGQVLATSEAFDGADVFMQAAGVAPTAVANIKADGARVRKVESGIESRTRQLTGQFVEAWSRGDQEGVTEVMAEIQLFNVGVGEKYRDKAMLIDRRQLEMAIKDRQTKALMLALSGGTAETKRQLMISTRTSGLFNQVTPETIQQNAGNLPGLPGLPGR